jgi:hypothetical protein
MFQIIRPSVMPLLGCASCYWYATAAVTGLSGVVTLRVRKGSLVTGRNAWTGVEEIQKRAGALGAANTTHLAPALFTFALHRGGARAIAIP